MTPFMPERDRGADRLKVALVGKQHWRRAKTNVAPRDLFFDTVRHWFQKAELSFEKRE